MILAEIQTIEAKAYQPCIIHFSKLAPKTKYLVALTGITQQDAISSIACITTFASVINTCRFVQLNHLGKPLIPSRDLKAIENAKENINASEASASILVHWNFGILQPEVVLNALRTLEVFNVLTQPTIMLDLGEEVVLISLVNHFRLLWQNKLYIGFLRTVSNLILTPWQHMLYGGFNNKNILQLDTMPASSRQWIEDQFQRLWNCYIGALFQPDAIIDEIQIFSFGATTLLRLPDPMEATQYTSLGRILHETQCFACIVCMSQPLLPLTPPEDEAKVTMVIEHLNNWNLRSAFTKLLVLAPTNDYGVVSTISLADTTSTFTQLLFGPFRPQNYSIDTEAKIYSVGKFSLHHSSVYCEPHYGYLELTMQRIKDQDGALANLGPVIGIVTSKSAKVLIEADQDCLIVCEAKDRITHITFYCRRKVRAQSPVVFSFENLQPQRRYDLIFHGANCATSSCFHTLQENAPALHLTWVANDDIFSLNAFNPVTTFWNDYLVNMTAFPSTDTILCLHRHIAAQNTIRSAMTHWSLYPNDKDAIVALFRQSIRKHWTINAAVLSSGSHCFLGSGFDWNELNIPISRDVVLWAREVAFEYQHHALWPELRSVERYGYHFQNNIGFLHIDTMEHRLDTDEDYLFNKSEFLSPKQWTLIKDVFAKENGTNCLVITCDVPFVWNSQQIQNNSILWNDWVMYPNELEKLFLLAFSWKVEIPSRNVVFVCAGQIGAKTMITRNNTSIEQIMVGPVTCGVPSDITLPEIKGESPTGQFAYYHTFQRGPLYTSTIVVPHPLKANVETRSSRHQQNNAKIVLGPVLGRITATSARILIEVDRDVEKCVCICTKANTEENVKSSTSLKAFIPSIFTLVDLKPQTEYTVSIEGLFNLPMARFWTPHQNPYSVKCLVVHDSTWRNLTNNSSLWSYILSSRAIIAKAAAQTSHFAGDTLGHDSNLWHGIVEVQASAPLQKPIVIIHNGAQVNLREAFTEKEVAFVNNSCRLMNNSLLALVHRMMNMDESDWSSLTSEIQFAMQEVYRVQWNMPPYKNVLGECSNIMLFHEKDLYFSLSIVESQLKDDIDISKATKAIAFFREIAQKVWFLYQNQLTTDINPESLMTTRTSSFVSYGLCTIISLNQNFSPIAKEAPTSKSAGIDLTKVTQANNLMPPGSWLVLDDALMYMKQESKILFASLCFDLLELTLNPIYLIGINRFFEKIFDWKNQAVDQRELHIVTLGQTYATYTITDQRSGGKCHLYQIVSITALSNISGAPLYPPTGSISKRFIYEKQGVSPTESTRSYLILNFLSDLNHVKCEEIRSHSPYALPCKATVGPIVGRLQIFKDVNTEKVTVTGTIMLEVNASCCITCIILDVLSGREIKLTIDMRANVPEQFVCNSLEPERRYAYLFEGIENSDKRKGTFHTPSANINTLNVVVVSSNFPQLRDKACSNVWQLLFERVKTPWHGIDMLLHIGGQVPLHEAAHECMNWLRDQFSNSPNTPKEDVIKQMRAKIVQRFQQEYRIAWNVPFVCEVLSNTSNLMIWTQNDIATTYGRATDMLLRAGFTENDLEAAKTIQEIAIEVCLMYQSSLGWKNDLLQDDELQNSTLQQEQSSLITAPPKYYGLLFDYIGFFIFDMRTTNTEDEMTCNKRLTKPLNPLDRPTISEAQWLAFENLLRIKSIRALVLVMEYPLLLTNTKLSPLESQSLFYNSFDMQAHWIACPALLEQLIALLFKWKEKFDGREVIIISGNMSIGLNTLLRNVKSSFLISTFATGPVIGSVNNFPFNDRGSFGPEKQYEFEHRFVPRLPNYILLEISIHTQTMNDTEARHYATCMSDIMHQENVFVLHKPTRLQRLPLWWRRYCIQEKQTFWSNIVVNTVDERITLTKYLANDKPYLNAIKKWYAKYNFVDTTRLTELQSNTSSKTIFKSIKQVVRELWSSLPANIKEVNCTQPGTIMTLDRKLALEQVQFNPSGPIDLERFRSLCAAIAKAACALKIAAKLAAEDAEMAYEAQQTQKKERLLVEAQEKQRQEAAAAQDAVQMQALQKSNILAYAEEMNRREKAKLDKAEAEKEAALAAKKALKEAMKRHNHDEEQKLHKEQRQLKALKERMEAHMSELGPTSEYNEMELEWSRCLREHQLHQQQRNESKYRASSKKNKATNNKDTS
ncbi:hypothetical protein THRCLA_02482 [Thraustotheca clavata]|uniref:Uncharacterized protein n=1 Tax=Thraustotheca clavata TaxID=74557 RepID=A0A1W0A506_9STRA|nr:hypothetical protein THRCLA_02482 [Thraustotheca clavata]